MPAFLNPARLLADLPIREGNTIADFGSGAGYYTLELAKQVGSTGKVYAFDVLIEACEATQARAKEAGLAGRIEVRRVNLEQPDSTALGPGTVDGVILANILFQSQAKEAILREARRIIKPEGWLFMVEWDPRSPLAPTRVQLLGMEETEKIVLETLGFSVSKRLKPDLHHWAILFTKSQK